MMKINNLFDKLFIVNADKAGQRIDNFLRMKLKNIPKSLIYKILRKGKVRINKKRVKPFYKLVVGDKVKIPLSYFRNSSKTNISPFLRKISLLNKVILYEDDYILVLNKPSGMVVHGGSGLKWGIIEGLRVLNPKTSFLELVHRLDQDTSGILLIAKKRSSLRILHEQLRNKTMRKNYLALVHGHWNPYIKSIRVPLLKNVLHSGERIVKVGCAGKASETCFNIEEHYKFATLMRCIPITGRTHQIRVHLQYAGHPIAFDDRYGNREFDKKLINTGLTRLFLHAHTLTFTHPNFNKTIYLEAPMDESLKRCLEILRD